MSGPKEIQFLFWEDCPSHKQCYIRLQEVISEEGAAAPITRTEILTDKQARELRFPGSPTILIDGRDIDPPTAKDVYYGLSCRTYRHEDGRISPMPSKETIRLAILATANR